MTVNDLGDIRAYIGDKDLQEWLEYQGHSEPDWTQTDVELLTGRRFYDIGSNAYGTIKGWRFYPTFPPDSDCRPGTYEIELMHDGGRASFMLDKLKYEYWPLRLQCGSKVPPERLALLPGLWGNEEPFDDED
jgi:hypothetical protein